MRTQNALGAVFQPPTARPIQPASCRSLSLSLFQNANLAPCGSDPDASWGTRGTHNWGPLWSLARPESLAHVYQSHSETTPPGPAGRRLCTLDEGSPEAVPGDPQFSHPILQGPVSAF